MSAAKPRVIITRKLPSGIEARMQQLFDVEFNATDTPFSREDLIAALGSADILVPTVTDEASLSDL